MKDAVKTAAYGILRNLSKAEVKELIQVLEYYNSTVKEDERADALRNGTAGKKDEATAAFEGKTAGSTNIYMQGGQSVCPCCKR